MAKKVSIKGAASRLRRFLKTADDTPPSVPEGMRSIGGNWYQPLRPEELVSQGQGLDDWGAGIQTQPLQAFLRFNHSNRWWRPYQGSRANLRPGWYDNGDAFGRHLETGGVGPDIDGGFGGGLVSGNSPYGFPGETSPQPQSAPIYRPPGQGFPLERTAFPRLMPAWEQSPPADAHGGIGHGVSALTTANPNPTPPIHYPYGPNFWQSVHAGGGINTGAPRSFNGGRW